MPFSTLHKCLVLAGSCLVLAGCSGSTGKGSVDTRTPAQKTEAMQQTVKDTMDMNKKAMEQQGMMTPPAGVGFQPPTGPQ